MVVLRMVIAVPLIPYFFDVAHGLWLAFVHFGNQSRIKRFAEPHPLWLNLQGFVEKVILAGDDINKVPNAARRMVRAIKVKVNPAGAVCKSARLAESANNFL